jgi:LSD1 subclass zinc finger protein
MSDKIFNEEHDETLETKCHDCGAILNFAPGTNNLKCQYCGAENEISSESEEAIEELDFDAFAKEAVKPEDTMQVATVKCTACGASSTLKPNISSDMCPFCSTPIIVTGGTMTSIIKPKSLLPFKVTQKEAYDGFKKWIKKLWFAPSALKKYATNPEKLKGMYIPFWTYDSDTYTKYSGARGTHYYVTESYTENGQHKTRQVQKTRWTPVSGSVSHFFDDILIVASNSLPRKYVDRLEPWDFENLANFDERYLSGFQTETYQVDLKSGFDLAKKVMESTIRNLVRRDIGGDEQRIYSMNTQYSNITFKHLLLPIWLSAYRFKKKVYRFLVNGRTGEVQGERPYSFWKIFFFILGILAVIAIVLFLFGAFDK